MADEKDKSAATDMEKMMMMMMESDPNTTEDLDSEYESVQAKSDLFFCCLCSCNCSNDRLFRMTCCGCIPIKAGIFIIGLLTIFLTIYEITYMFVLILNARCIIMFNPLLLVIDSSYSAGSPPSPL